MHVLAAPNVDLGKTYSGSWQNPTRILVKPNAGLGEN